MKLTLFALILAVTLATCINGQEKESVQDLCEGVQEEITKLLEDTPNKPVSYRKDDCPAINAANNMRILDLEKRPDAARVRNLLSGKISSQTFFFLLDRAEKTTGTIEKLLWDITVKNCLSNLPKTESTSIIDPTRCKEIEDILKCLKTDAMKNCPSELSKAGI